MDKQEIIRLLNVNYGSFVNYVNGLSAEEYSFTCGKWTAGQQLQHMVLCVGPLVKVFSMDKAAIAQTFGSTERHSRTYDMLLSDYLAKLSEGGKAPERFVPEPSLVSERERLCETLTKMTADLCSKIETFSEDELDHLLLPHPLLGNLTLREMLYNAIYHVQHHQAQIREHLR